MGALLWVVIEVVVIVVLNEEGPKLNERFAGQPNVSYVCASSNNAQLCSSGALCSTTTAKRTKQTNTYASH